MVGTPTAPHSGRYSGIAFRRDRTNPSGEEWFLVCPGLSVFATIIINFTRGSRAVRSGGHAESARSLGLGLRQAQELVQRSCCYFNVRVTTFSGPSNWCGVIFLLLFSRCPRFPGSLPARRKKVPSSQEKSSHFTIIFSLVLRTSFDFISTRGLNGIINIKLKCFSSLFF